MEVELNRVPYNVKFRLDIASTHKSDLFQIMEQILTWFKPSLCLKANLNPYIGDDKVLLNSCWENKRAYHTRLRKILDPHFEVIELVYDCKKDRDSWCYLNYLQLPNAILLPCLSNNADCENDIAAIETFKNIFPNLKIIPIYAKPLIQEGGALHCVTWEYIEYNNHKYCE